jgi:hypothetical protein
VLEARDADSELAYYIRAFPLQKADPVTGALLMSVVLEPHYAQTYNPGVSPTVFGHDMLALRPSSGYRVVVVAEDGVTGDREYDFRDFRTLGKPTERRDAEFDASLNTITWEAGVEYGLP